jgi:hypothetical protein
LLKTQQLDGNPLICPPVHIAQGGHEVVREYILERERRLSTLIRLFEGGASRSDEGEDEKDEAQKQEDKEREEQELEEKVNEDQKKEEEKQEEELRLLALPPPLPEAIIEQKRKEAEAKEEAKRKLREADPELDKHGNVTNEYHSEEEDDEEKKGEEEKQNTNAMANHTTTNDDGNNDNSDDNSSKNIPVTPFNINIDNTFPKCTNVISIGAEYLLKEDLALFDNRLDKFINGDYNANSLDTSPEAMYRWILDLRRKRNHETLSCVLRIVLASLKKLLKTDRRRKWYEDDEVHFDGIARPWVRQKVELCEWGVVVLCLHSHC